VGERAGLFSLGRGQKSLASSGYSSSLLTSNTIPTFDSPKSSLTRIRIRISASV
jgi:hypothetical protein